MGRRLRRLLARLLALGIVGVLVVLIGLVGLLASILGRAMPETSGTIRLPGLSGPVDVLRDENGFVHIYADTPEDLFAAQGWVHASERMWQMELWRRIGAGRLSELFGEATLDTDRFVRTLGWRRAAERVSAGHDVVQLEPGVERDARPRKDRSAPEPGEQPLGESGSERIAGGAEFAAEEERRAVAEEVGAAVRLGEAAVALPAARDHKRLLAGDRGPNTGGMGAYSDSRILNPGERTRIMQTIIYPTLERMQELGTPFTGFLYAGLMMTIDGPKVLEFNVRLGDPEAQPLMYRMVSDFLATLVDGAPIEWSPEPSVCVVLAAAGYPATPRTGDLITGIDACGATVFHAGTRQTERGLVTAGGRVLGVTSSGPDLPSAIRNTYDAVRKIHFEGMHYRTDIGRKGLKRW